MADERRRFDTRTYRAADAWAYFAPNETYTNPSIVQPQPVPPLPAPVERVVPKVRGMSEILFLAALVVGVAFGIRAYKG